MIDDQVMVRSVTGIDLSLSLAGPGTRSYAFLIDWHIRVLLAGAWLVVAFFIFDFKLNVKSRDGFFSILPAALIYFLYHPVLEIGMHGRTPGKRMAGIRILGRQGGPPSITALLIRNVFRLIDSLPAMYMIGLACCFLTANRVRIGDMAAGTLLVLDNAEAEKSLARIEALASRSILPLDALELVDQVLERWNSLESANRAAIARALLTRLDPATDLIGMDESALHDRLKLYV